MKFYSLLIILQCVISLGLKSQTSIIELSNSEVSSILKSYDPSLDIDTACVTCRYIAQKIYKVEFIRNNVRIGDFIPCYKDGQEGMWDKVNKEFHPNLGTNNFVCGPVKEPEYE